MNSADFKQRTKSYALRVVRLVNALPNGRSVEILGRQLLRCATSVGANYRAACRARSTADFISKLCIVEEEADEAIYWMELLIEGGMVPKEKLSDLVQEGNEILAMIVSSIRTAKAKVETSSTKSKTTNSIKDFETEYVVRWMAEDSEEEIDKIDNKSEI